MVEMRNLLTAKISSYLRRVFQDHTLLALKEKGNHFLFLIKKKLGGWSGGAQVKSARSASTAWGSPVWIPGADTACEAMLWQASNI